MIWFLIPLVISGLMATGLIFLNRTPNWVSKAALVMALMAIPIMVCIDLPNRDRGVTIPTGTCLECKIQTEDSFYAIGCDGHQYKLNMSAWALLDSSVCK